MRFANKRRPWARRDIGRNLTASLTSLKIGIPSLRSERAFSLSVGHRSGAPLGTRCERARSGAEAINLHFPNDTAITHLKYLHADHVGGSIKVSPDKSLALPMSQFCWARYRRKSYERAGGNFSPRTAGKSCGIHVYFFYAILPELKILL